MTMIKAQMPGVFYRRSAPNKPNYVENGDTVREGETIALIEVMKTFNEIKAESDGVVDKFLIEDADEIEVGQDIVDLKSS